MDILRDGLNPGSLATRVSLNTILANVLLTVFKLFSGVYARSDALLSDAVHSLSDVFTTIIVLIGVRVSEKSADENHQYGHERFESVAAILLSVMLAGVAFGIGYRSAMKLFGAGAAAGEPGSLALAAAAFSIITKETMYWYTRAAAKKINSGALMADAWHHRSDALSSVGSFAGVFGARMGYPLLDPAAGVIIAGFILKVAYDIFLDAVSKMTDEACDRETSAMIGKIISEREGVIGIDSLQTRRFGERIYVDVEISADGDLSLQKAHEIAESVHDKIEEEFRAVKHCMVHVNPAKDDKIQNSRPDQKDREGKT
jgi:cation diffusion facilitator family transporter